MPFTIQMDTPRDILLAGGWATEAELNQWTIDQKRNTLISELVNHSNMPAAYFQGGTDEALVGVGAVIVFLKAAGIKTDAQLKTMSAYDQVYCLAIENETHLDIALEKLQAESAKALVTQGLQWFNGETEASTIEALLELDWHIDQAQALNEAPLALTSTTVENEAGDNVTQSVTLSQVVTNGSTFLRSDGFEIKAGTKLTVQEGIPMVEKNGQEYSFSISTAHTWNWGTNNETSQSYSATTTVSVPKGAKVLISAMVTQVKLNVPYTATIRAEDQSIKTIQGTWSGVSTFDLVIKQTPVD